MRKFLRRGFFLSLLLALAFPLVSCDSGGSGSSDGPSWTGNWEVTKNVNGNVPTVPVFYSIDKDQFTSIQKLSNRCIPVNDNDEIVDIDDNVLTIDTDGGRVMYRFDVSGDVLTVTALEDSPNFSAGDEVTAQRIDEDARDAAGCS